MDFDKLYRKIETLEEEQKQNMKLFSQLQDRLAILYDDVKLLSNDSKAVNNDVARLSILGTRFENVDKSLAELKIDLSKKLEELEKTRADQNRERDQIRRDDLNSINKSLNEFKKETAALEDIKKKQTIIEEEGFRVSRSIDELEKRLDLIIKSNEETVRSQRAIVEGRSQDTKKVSDLNSEMSIFRRRLEEQHGVIDLIGDNVRKIELRLKEMLTAENERKHTQQAFIEKQNMAEVERERIWKEWGMRFSDISNQSLNLDVKIKEVENTHRELKRTKDDLDEAPGAYKDITTVMENQKDLVEIVVELKPLAVVKG